MEIIVDINTATKYVLEGSVCFNGEKVDSGVHFNFDYNGLHKGLFLINESVTVSCDLDFRDKFVESLVSNVPQELLLKCKWDPYLQYQISCNKWAFDLQMLVKGVKVETVSEPLVNEEETVSYEETLKDEFDQMVREYAIKNATVTDEERKGFVKTEVEKISRLFISSFRTTNSFDSIDYLLPKLGEKFGDEETTKQIDQSLRNVLCKGNPYMEVTVAFSLGETEDVFNKITISVEKKI